MNLLYRDILVGLMFIFGIVGFISGQFIVSSVLFALAAILSNSNLHVEKKLTNTHLPLAISYLSSHS
jgi:hypothetical protein